MLLCPLCRFSVCGISEGFTWRRGSCWYMFQPLNSKKGMHPGVQLNFHQRGLLRMHIGVIWLLRPTQLTYLRNKQLGSTVSTNPSLVRDLPGILFNTSTALQGVLVAWTPHLLESFEWTILSQINRKKKMVKKMCAHIREDLQVADPLSSEVVLASSFQKALVASTTSVHLQDKV